jgi:hypothetical protein
MFREAKEILTAKLKKPDKFRDKAPFLLLFPAPVNIVIDKILGIITIKSKEFICFQ